jgi:hypothetical protein
MADFSNTDAQLAMSGFYGPNKYSNFQNQRLPMPGYVGTPTDAMGNPIQAQPGTTLNTPPPSTQIQAPAPAAGGDPMSAMYQAIGARGGGYMPISSGGQVSGGAASTNAHLEGGQNIMPQYQYVPPQQAAPAAPQAQGQAANPGGSLDTALSLLANPGKVTTPGANGPSSTPQSNVLQQFLANNKGGTGAGNYSNQGFFNTLNALKGGAQPQQGGGGLPPAIQGGSGAGLGGNSLSGGIAAPPSQNPIWGPGRGLTPNAPVTSPAALMAAQRQLGGQ